MKLLFILGLVAFGSAATTSRPSTCSEKGKKLIYHYEATGRQSVIGTQPPNGSLLFDFTVEVIVSGDSPVAILKIVNANIMSTVPTRPMGKQYQLTEDLMNYSLPFEMTGGRVIRLFPDPHDPEEIINIKRGIISMLQVEVSPTDGKRFIEETDVLGKCKTELTQSTLNNEISILKTKDTTRCEGRPIYTTLDTTMNPEAKFLSGLSAGSFKLNLQRELLYAQVSQQEVISPLSKEPGQIMSILMQTLELTGSHESYECIPESDLKTRDEGSLVFDFSRSVRPEDMETAEAAMLIINKLPELTAQQIPEIFLQLIETMRHLNRMELQELNDTFADYKKVDVDVLSSDIKASKVARDIMDKHSFFLDALAYVGTEPALDLIVELASGSEGSFLSFTRKTELAWSIAAVPIHDMNACKLLNYSLELAERNRIYQAPTLALGTVMYKVLEIPNQQCQEEIASATRFLVSKLNESINMIPTNFDLQKDTEDNKPVKKYWERVVHTIKALGNSGVKKTIKAVLRVLREKKLLTEARTAAVYALKRVIRRNPFQVQDIAMNVFFNTLENEEVRIAAFTIVMDLLNSPFNIMMGWRQRQLMIKLTAEPNSYVKSYVCSYLRAVERSSDPSLFRLRYIVFAYVKPIGLLQTCAAEDKGYFSSKADLGFMSLADCPLAKSLPQDVMGFGFSSGVVFTPPISPKAPASWLPRSGSIKLQARAFGYEADLLELGARGTGIERLIQHLFGPAGYFRRGTREMDVSGLPRHATQERMIVDIPQENISASGFIKLLGNEIGWNHVEQGNIMRALYTNSPQLNILRETLTDAFFTEFEFGKLREIIQMSLEYVRYLTNGKLPLYHGKTNITKSVRIVNVKHSVPTILGIPLNLTVLTAGYMKLDAEVEVCYHNEAPIRSLWEDKCQDRVEATGYVHPKFSLMSQAEVVLDAYEIQPKLVFRGNANSEFRQRVKAVLHNNYNANIQLLEMPEMNNASLLNASETTLLDASYIQYFESEGVVEIIGIEKRDKTELYQPLSEAGLTLLTDVSYPNSTGVSLAPWFPLSGPAKFTITISKTSPLLEGLSFTFWNDTAYNTVDNGYFNYSIDAMGIGRVLDASAIWLTNPNKTSKVATVTITSMPANFSAIINVNPRHYIDMNGSLDTTISNTNVFAIWDSTHVYAYASRIRYAKDHSTAIVKIPEFSLEVDALLSNQMYGNISALLYLEGSEQPQWLRSSFTVKSLFFNVRAESSKFSNWNLGFALPLPLKKPVCHVFNGHFITFDNLKFDHNLGSECEYVLIHHRHPNDTFGVTIKGGDINVYINQTKYTLTQTEYGLNVNDIPVEELPYKVKHVINVRKVQHNNQKYIRLTAWAGVDIFYNHGDILVSINGFFMNQTAGLCGNANYNGLVADEMRGPDFQLAEDVTEFVQMWDMKHGQCESSPRVPITNSNLESRKACDVYFKEVLSDVHIHIDPNPFYNACIFDVSRGSSDDNIHSIRAYYMAAHSKSIDVDGCQYGLWSDWSDCENKSRTRTRPLLKNILKNQCATARETQHCSPDDKCIKSKEHVVTYHGSKVCKSVRHLPTCSKNCVAVTKDKPTQFQCVGDGSSLSKIANKSPVTINFPNVVRCDRQQ